LYDYRGFDPESFSDYSSGSTILLPRQRHNTATTRRKKTNVLATTCTTSATTTMTTGYTALQAFDACKLRVIQCANMNTSVFQEKTSLIWTFEEIRHVVKWSPRFVEATDDLRIAAANITDFIVFLRRAVGDEVLVQAGISDKIYKEVAGHRKKYLKNGFRIDGDKFCPTAVATVLSYNKIINMAVCKSFYAPLCFDKDLTQQPHRVLRRPRISPPPCVPNRT
jgi:hypothetical protein